MPRPRNLQRILNKTTRKNTSGCSVPRPGLAVASEPESKSSKNSPNTTTPHKNVTEQTFMCIFQTLRDSCKVQNKTTHPYRSNKLLGTRPISCIQTFSLFFGWVASITPRTCSLRTVIQPGPYIFWYSTNSRIWDAKRSGSGSKRSGTLKLNSGGSVFMGDVDDPDWESRGESIDTILDIGDVESEIRL